MRTTRLVSILLLFVNLFPSPALALVKTVSDGSGSYTVEDHLNYPVIFIPGVGGSTLDDPSGKNIWPGALITTPSTFDALKLTDTGSQTVPLKASGTVRYGLGDDYGIGGEWYSFPVYQGFYDYMASMGYSMDPDVKTGKRLFDFPYDFRMDTRSHIADLDKKINQVLALTKSNRVILYAHSMGGYLARLYMQDPSRAKKVAGVVFMGTPHHGAAMPLWALTEGYNFGNKKLSDEKMWEVSGNWPGGYQLLADFPILQDEKGTFLTPEQAYSGSDWISTREYQKYLYEQVNGRTYTPVAGIPNKKMALDGLAFHKTVLGDAVTPYPWASYYMIKGVSQPTTQYFEEKLSPVPGLAKPLLSLTQIKTPKGDATVPSPGAKIDGVKEVIEVPAEHGDIPSNAQAQLALTRIQTAINKSDLRNQNASKLSTRANAELATLRSNTFEEPTDKEESLPVAIFKLLFFGQPDKEKIRMKNEIGKQIKNLFADGQINIEMGTKGTDSEDDYYVGIQNQTIIGAGPGEATSARFTVSIPNPADFQAFLSGSLSARDGYYQNKFIVSGNGLVATIKAKLLQWIGKYGAK